MLFHILSTHHYKQFPEDQKKPKFPFRETFEKTLDIVVNLLEPNFYTFLLSNNKINKWRKKSKKKTWKEKCQPIHSGDNANKKGKQTDTYVILKINLSDLEQKTGAPSWVHTPTDGTSTAEVYKKGF